MVFLNFYDVLGLPLWCHSGRKIYAAYQERLQELSSDPCRSRSFISYQADAESTAKIAICALAYSTLSNEKQRNFYDLLLADKIGSAKEPLSVGKAVLWIIFFILPIVFLIFLRLMY